MGDLSPFWFGDDAFDDRDLLYDFEQQQRRSPDRFLYKLYRKQTFYDPPGRVNDANLSVEQVGRVLAAADFALVNGVFLDTLVTIDFARQGLVEGKECQAALRTFLKTYGQWCTERRLHGAWIYCIEAKTVKGEVKHHAHIALYVPGHPQWDTVTDKRAPNLRTDLNKWCHRTNTKYPKAARARSSRAESNLRHWLRVTYLLKGYEPTEVIQSERFSPNKLPMMLGDIMPWPYCNPGPVQMPSRIGISESLGPAQRRKGHFPGREHVLPSTYNPMAFNAFGDLPKEKRFPFVPTYIYHPKPFLSAWESGVRDVRGLYGKEFCAHVIKL